MVLQEQQSSISPHYLLGLDVIYLNLIIYWGWM